MSFRKHLFLSTAIAVLAGAAVVPAQFIRGVNERQVRTVLQRLETKTDSFRSVLDRRMDNSRLNNTGTEDSIASRVAAFENATDELRNNFNSRRSTNNDVEKVMTNGWYIDSFMRSNRLGANVERQWQSIRTDLNTLSRYYNVSWNWNQTLPAWNDQAGNNRLADRITGTYRLNTRMSDNVRTAVRRAVTGNAAAAVRQRQNLERRLASPQNMAIEMRGDQFTLGTNLSDRGTMTVDGRAISETNARGRTTTTTVGTTGDTLTISTEGDRSNDFSVSFTPVGNRQLRVTRRIYLEGRDDTVTVNSVYDRTADIARWPAVDRRPNVNTRDNRSGNFYIPNGTQLTATLENRIATNISQAGDRFTMRVTSPANYRGAIITGRIADLGSSGRVSGRANVGLDFESIRMGNRTYDFAGIVDSARETDGDTINVSNEGEVRDGNQTTRTVTRAGIGAVVGALIGAITGGGDGAAIGAGIGAGAGAGSVLIQGRDNIDLQIGSEFTITSTGPTGLVGRQ